MPLSINDGGVWKSATPYVNDGGTWKPVQVGYVNDGGAWKVFYSALAATYDIDASAAISGAGTAVTNAVTVSPIGGVSPFQYAWSYVSGDTFSVANPGPSPTANVTTFSTSLSTSQTKSAFYRCTITDANGSTAFVDVSVTAIETS
jgi:hypothetical protein